MTSRADNAVPTLRAPVSGAIAGLSGPVGQTVVREVPRQVVSRFQPGHGWTSTGTGAVTDDTAEYLFGTQSLRLTSAGNGSYCSARRTGIPAFDLEQNLLRVWLRVTSAAPLQQLLVYVSSGGFVGSLWGAFDLKPVGNYPILRNGEWACLVFGKEEFTSLGTGPPVWSAIDAMQFSVLDNQSAPATVHVGAIDVVPRPPVSYCSFTFDDGYEEVYTKARPLMDAYGFTGTVFIIADIIGTPGFMSMAQLKKLETAGWEVAAHSETLADHNQPAGLFSSTPYNLRRNLLGQRQWLWGNGFRGTGIAYPRGAHDAVTRAEVRKVYTYARSVVSPAGSEAFPPADQMQLRAHEIYQATTPASINTIVSTAVAGKRWVILEFHGIKDAPPGGDIYQYVTANFATVVANVAAQPGLVVLPVCDVMSGAWV